MTDNSIPEEPVIPQDIKFKRDQNRIFDRAEKAMIHIHQTFDQWLVAGRAFQELQSEAVLRSNSSGPSGRAYSDWYEVLHAKSLEGRPHLAKVGKTGRSLAIWMVENEEAVRNWRDTILDDEQRFAWNSPSTIKREFGAWQVGSAAMPIDIEESDDRTVADIFPADEFPEADEEEPQPRKKTRKKRKTSDKELSSIIGQQSEEIVQLKATIRRLHQRIRRLESQLRRAGIAVEGVTTPGVDTDEAVF
jgi:hypothetical protein